MNNIVEKIKKLLVLSEDKSNEHVAELASAKAQELIAEHNIKEIMLINDDDDSVTREDPKWQGYIFRSNKCATWKVNLCSALANANQGRVGITSGIGVKFLGARVDYDLVCAMFTWISEQLNDMAKRKTHGSVEANNYRRGAVSTIRKRLMEAKKKAEAKLELDAMMEENETGIVLYQNALTELKNYDIAVAERASSLMSGSWRGGASTYNRSAFQQGIKDGESVSLSGHRLHG